MGVGWLAVLVFGLSVLWQPVAAQGSSAADMLPAPTAFGDDWALLATPAPTAEISAAFRDVAFGVYGGPNGARITLVVYLVAEGMTAVRDSWEIANKDYEAYRLEMDWGFQSTRETETATAPLPAGCADARRIYGVEKIGFQTFPVGLTLCASDPDVIVLAYASGEVNGLSGYEASDAAVAATVGSSATTADATEAP